MNKQLKSVFSDENHAELLFFYDFATLVEDNKFQQFEENINIDTITGGHGRSNCNKKSKKSFMARSLPVENLPPQNVGSIINFLH